MNRIKYLLDEHVDPRLRRGMKRRRPEIIVWCVGDAGAPSLSTSDPDILLWCESADFLLVTNNRASMPVHLREHLAEDKHMPGIFILNSKFSMGETMEELILIWETSTPDEYRDQLRYLPISQ